MKNYIGTCIPANWYSGKQNINGKIGFSKTSLIFYCSSKRYYKEKIEIDYSEIVWIEKKKTYKIHSNKMTIFTKKNAEYTFVVNERDDVIEFLDSRVKFVTEKPMDYKERLYNTTGEKIKRQYFNVPLYMMLSFLIPIPVYIMPIYDVILNKDGIPRYTLIDMLEMLQIIFICLVPLFVLSLLNRFWFGRIVCVLNQEGVHYEHGLIPWEEITNIEYEIEVPGRYSHDYCFARLLGDELDTRLMIHAPYYFTRRAKKYNSKIKVQFSKGSRSVMIFFATMPLVCSILVVLIKS